MCKCLRCGRKLVPVGYARANGASHNDWDSRQFHKCCWVGLGQWERDVYWDNCRVYVNVAFVDRGRAKSEGLRWDAEERCWYALDKHAFDEQSFRAKHVYVDSWFNDITLNK